MKMRPEPLPGFPDAFFEDCTLAEQDLFHTADSDPQPWQ